MFKRFTTQTFSATDPDPSRDARFEIKFAHPEARLPDVRAQVQLNSAGFVRQHAPRQVNNIYFDTEELTSIVMNEDGIGRRLKTRLRWYGDNLASTAGGVIELKSKSGQHGWKERYPIPRSSNLEQSSWHDVWGEVVSQLPDDVRARVEPYCRATLINSYHREYFATMNGDIRLTIDSDIRSFSQLLSPRPTWGRTRQITDDALIVVELKAPTGSASALRDAASQLGWRVSRHSKYVRGAAPGYA